MHTPKFPHFANFDAFIIRNEINASINSLKHNLSGRLLDVGCGRMPYKDEILNSTTVTEYIGLDIENPIYNDDIFKPDVFWDGLKIPFEDNTFDSIILFEVLEHTDFPEQIISECFRVLKPKGKLLFSVPFIFYYHDTPHDFNRYTFYKLKSMFEKNNFNIKTIFGYGNWNTTLAHFWALWIKRSALPKFIRFGLYLLSLPLYLLLYKKGIQNTTFKTLDICIGHFGLVEK
ncbi:MAG: class I SAM-dependent methyltransferase [Chitinophagaceae bacterium]|nr:class I SAM-dependent methyltransferase [Chitinophagaceae bacterium]